MSVAIQAMTPADWEQVRTIYLEGIASGQATFETEPPPWEKWDASHRPDCRLVARCGERVVGWAVLAPVSGRACYAGVAEVSVNSISFWLNSISDLVSFRSYRCWTSLRAWFNALSNSCRSILETTSKE